MPPSNLSAHNEAVVVFVGVEVASDEAFFVCPLLFNISPCDEPAFRSVAIAALIGGDENLEDEDQGTSMAGNESSLTQ